VPPDPHRPADTDGEGLAEFALAEAAKRRLLYELLDLGLPLDESRLRFDLLSSSFSPVVTGHADGLVTIDLASPTTSRASGVARSWGSLTGRCSAISATRSAITTSRSSSTSGGRTRSLVDDQRGQDALARCRELFGDERADYTAAQERHYGEGSPKDWAEHHVSAYATMHPCEDWAEAFAHYLHIRDTMQTAAAFGLVVTGPAPVDDPALTSAVEAGAESIEQLIDGWLPLTYALNAVNRSMGGNDLYPFTLAPAVIEKLGYVHDAIRAA
jgi:hypothetical protein